MVGHSPSRWLHGVISGSFHVAHLLPAPDRTCKKVCLDVFVSVFILLHMQKNLASLGKNSDFGAS